MKTGSLLGLAVGVALTSTAFAGPRASGPLPTQYIDFESVPLGAPATGLTIGGIQFSYNGSRGSTGAVIANSFGPTAHTEGHVLQGSTFGLLGMTFAKPVSSFSLGFALQFEGDVPDGLRMDIFDPEGGFIESLSFDAEQDGYDIRGGGAEYASARAVTGGSGRIGMAVLSFESMVDPLRGDDNGNFIPLFEIDNIEVNFIPLPSPALLTGFGLVGMASVWRRRSF